MPEPKVQVRPGLHPCITHKRPCIPKTGIFFGLLKEVFVNARANEPEHPCLRPYMSKGGQGTFKCHSGSSGGMFFVFQTFLSPPPNNFQPILIIFLSFKATFSEQQQSAREC
mmetsp:Transcript_3678/g.8330  ORF Transcript_3678/g.8330 Transcript_3678/m.8330 type:complete len:112 (-) Transcript_3678:10-345(-)